VFRCVNSANVKQKRSLKDENASNVERIFAQIVPVMKTQKCTNPASYLGVQPFLVPSELLGDLRRYELLYRLDCGESGKMEKVSVKHEVMLYCKSAL
jgi:hypothetical protein